MSKEQRELVKRKYDIETTCLGEVMWNDIKCIEYKIVLRNTNGEKVDCVNFFKTMTLQYFMGVGLYREPTIDDVLYTLSLEAVDEDMSFEMWCDEFGYNDDSIKSKKIYDQVVEQTTHFKALVGDDFDSIREAYSDL